MNLCSVEMQDIDTSADGWTRIYDIKRLDILNSVLAQMSDWRRNRVVDGHCAIVLSL